MDTSKRSGAVITSTKETLSGTSWSCLSDFCHFDKMTLSHFGPLGEIRKAYKKLKTIIKRKCCEETWLTSFWTQVCKLCFSDLGRTGLCPELPAEAMCMLHTMHIWSKGSSCLPWASIGIVLMLWLQSGKRQAPSGICREIYRFISY